MEFQFVIVIFNKAPELELVWSRAENNRWMSRQSRDNGS